MDENTRRDIVLTVNTFRGNVHQYNGGLHATNMLPMVCEVSTCLCLIVLTERLMQMCADYRAMIGSWSTWHRSGLLAVVSLTMNQGTDTYPVSLVLSLLVYDSSACCFR